MKHPVTPSSDLGQTGAIRLQLLEEATWLDLGQDRYQWYHNLQFMNLPPGASRMTHRFLIW